LTLPARGEFADGLECKRCREVEVRKCRRREELKTLRDKPVSREQMFQSRFTIE
jgi:hypothetical protein